MNLLNETIEILKDNGKTEQDVLWVGNEEKYSISWEEFSKIANKEYDEGYGSEEVCKDVLVVGKNFWLERHQYDGLEWWEYKTMPIQPKKGEKIKNLFIKDYKMYLKENN